MPVRGASSVRTALLTDSDAIFGLACALAVSFVPTRQAFDANLGTVLSDADARVLVADDHAGAVVGYLLGFAHPTFFADGLVTWIEEVVVSPDRRRLGLGRALVSAFEEWSRARHARLVALATRRADDFYDTLGYERSAVYFRKRLVS
jgi:GNAT superfamily N-acetyltransferase